MTSLEPDQASALPKVLVVDDIPANLAVMEATLECLDCELVLKSSGNDALRALLRGGFAVMLLDVQMPGMDGYEVAHLARQNPVSRDVPIIFLTAAHRDDEHVQRGYGSGAVDFLFKPTDTTILQSKVRIFLELYVKSRQIADAKQRLEAAYEELKTTQAHLIQSAKMASLGELVAGVAHEINNPLSFCISHVQTARKDVASLSSGMNLSSGVKEEALAFHCQRALNRLDETGTGLQRIQEIVRNLRTFSRADEGERKFASMREGIESVVFMLEHKLRGRIVVNTSFGGPELVECAPSLLNQAVMNLVANAIDAINDSGEIHIATDAQEGEYIIRVTDSGQGIAPEHQERVFEPFFTTKPVGEGTGLGLSISYSIAKAHGGTLKLENAPGGGTIATLRFPIRTRASSDPGS